MTKKTNKSGKAKKFYEPPQKPGRKPKKSPPSIVPRSRRLRSMERGEVKEAVNYRPGRSSTLYDKIGEAARVLVVERRMSHDEAAKALNTRRENLIRWSLKYGWKKQRESQNLGPQALLPDLIDGFNKMVSAMQNTMKDTKKVPDAKFWDAVQKATSAIEKLSGNAYFPKHLTDTVEFLKTYLELSNKQPLLKELAEILPGFASWALANRK